jgi:hypothetical protein
MLLLVLSEVFCQGVVFVAHVRVVTYTHSTFSFVRTADRGSCNNISDCASSLFEIFLPNNKK